MNRSRWLCPAWIAPDGRVASGGTRLLVTLMCLAVFLLSPNGTFAAEVYSPICSDGNTVTSLGAYGEKGDTFNSDRISYGTDTILYTYPKTGFYMFTFNDYDLSDGGTYCDDSGDYYNRTYCNDSDPPKSYPGYTFAGTTVTYYEAWNVNECDDAWVGWYDSSHAGYYTFTMSAYYWGTLEKPCEVEASISPGSVWPTGGTIFPNGLGGNTKAEISVSLKQPAPAGGCMVKLDKIVPVTKSGGHDHNALNDGREDKVGSLSPDSIFFGEGQYLARKIHYTSNEVSGTEKIKLKIINNSQVEGTTELEVDVKVPGLEQPFYGGDKCILTGQTDEHALNHYGTSETQSKIWLTCQDYYAQTNVKLGINDISLEWGGMFDISGQWSTPHDTHRIGRGADINLCGEVSDFPGPIHDFCAGRSFGNTKIDRDVITELCEKHGRKLANEATLHCNY